MAADGPIEHLSAITLVTSDMASSVAFYEVLGFEVLYGGHDAAFTSFAIEGSFLNLQLDPMWVPPAAVWGRSIWWVADVDATYAAATAAGLSPEAPPADAPWGERYFHLRDPDGHQLSIARPR